MWNCKWEKWLKLFFKRFWPHCGACWWQLSHFQISTYPCSHPYAKKVNLTRIIETWHHFITHYFFLYLFLVNVILLYIRWNPSNDVSFKYIPKRLMCKMCKIGCLDLIFFYYLVLISSCFLIISCFVENCSIFNWVSFCFFQLTVITWNEALIWNKSLSNCISWKCGVKNIQVITYCKKPKLGTMYQVWLQSTKQFSIPMLA